MMKVVVTQGTAIRSVQFFCTVVAGALLGAVYPALASTLDDAAERLRPSLAADIGDALTGARKLHERLVAHDLDGARKAWIGARVGWERAEVFTSGFVPDLDEKIDAWPNALTGFHAIEAKLFVAGQTDMQTEANTLVFYLTDLDIKVQQAPLSAQRLLAGVARLAYEIGENKADGGESRFSGTSLDDMRNNLAGIRTAYDTVFAAALERADAALAQAIGGEIERLKDLLDTADLKSIDSAKLRAASEALVIRLQDAAPKLGLRKPTLEELVQ
jgi:iron uptake system component EfeO